MQTLQAGDAGRTFRRVLEHVQSRSRLPKADLEHSPRPARLADRRVQSFASRVRLGEQAPSLIDLAAHTCQTPPRDETERFCAVIPGSRELVEVVDVAFNSLPSTGVPFELREDEQHPRTVVFAPA